MQLTRESRLKSEEHIRQVLEQRAQVLAQTAEAEVERDLTDFIIVTVGQEKFALEIPAIQEIQTLRGLTSVPGAGDVWSGVVNLRGRLLPVLDMARTLGINATAGAFYYIVVSGSAPSDKGAFTLTLSNSALAT